MRHRLRFVIAVVLGLPTIFVLFLALGSLTLELFFIISFITFIAVVEMTAPDIVSVPWRRKLNWVIIVGLMISSLLLGHRIMTVLPDQWLSP